VDGYALLAGPFIGEFGWELLRFAPHVLWKKFHCKSHEDLNLIVFTRPSSFDLYGSHAAILVPFRLEGDGTKFFPNCFRLENFPEATLRHLTESFKEKYKQRFQVIEHVVPDISGKNFASKTQFPSNQMCYDFQPRRENATAISQYRDKKVVVLAPRFSPYKRRNWLGWQQLYDLIYDSLSRDFFFVICGKHPEYVPDAKGRFLDINDLVTSDSVSHAGITIEFLKIALLTVGSQSSVPLLSLLLKTPCLMWGHQRYLHTVSYNVLKTPVVFLDDENYTLSPKIIFDKIVEVLYERLKNNARLRSSRNDR